MKLVLSGYYGFDNVGDEAILYAIISALREANPMVDLTVLSNNPEKTASEYGVKAVNRWKLTEIATAIRTSDGVISGGGSLLQDETGNRSVIYYSAIMWIAKLFRKPYFIYAQGIGPLKSGRNKKIVRFTLTGSKLLTVRDIESKQLLETIGVKNDIHLVPDPVLGIDHSVVATEPRIVEAPFIAVSVRDWPTEYNYKKKLAHSLDELVRSGYDIVFIPMHGKADAETAEETIALMKEEAIVAPHDGTITQKIAWITQSELLIGMRLHALIFAAVGDIPFVALSYDPKINSFTKLCNQPLAAHVNEDWDPEVLTSLAKRQLTNRKEAIEQMLNYTREAKRQAQQTAKEVLKKF